MMEMTLIVATITQRLRLGLLPDQPTVQIEPLLALRPRGGLTMSTTRRHARRVFRRTDPSPRVTDLV